MSAILQAAAVIIHRCWSSLQHGHRRRASACANMAHFPIISVIEPVPAPPANPHLRRHRGHRHRSTIRSGAPCHPAAAPAQVRSLACPLFVPLAEEVHGPRRRRGFTLP
ncbi:MAG: hypothetical protein ACLSTO_11390 [Bilophila wadsworthia]